MKHLILLMIFVAACSTTAPAESTSEQKPQMEPEPQPSPAAEPMAEEAPAEEADEPDAADEADEADEEPARPSVEWKFKTEFDALLGFSADGALYAVNSSVGHEEEPGWPEFWIQFIEVRETKSHKPVAIYPGQKPTEIPEDWGFRPEDVTDDEEKAALAYWKKANKQYPKPVDLKKLGIQEPKKVATKALQFRTEGATPGATKFVVKAGNPATYKWTGFDDKARQGSQEPPWIVVSSAGAELFKWRPKYKAEDVLEMADMDVPWMEGRLTVYAFGNPPNYAIIVTSQVLGVHEEMGSMFTKELVFVPASR